MIIIPSLWKEHELPSVKWKKITFIVLALLVQAALFIKCPLLILRQISPTVLLPQTCPEVNRSSDSVGQEYVFTMVVFSGLFLGSWAESLVIHIHIYKFFFRQPTLKPTEFIQLCKKGLTSSKKILLGVTAVYMVLHAFAIPILGIILETKHGQSNCERYVYEHHFVYWVFDTVYHLHDVAIYLLMFLATVAVVVLWTVNEENEQDECETQPTSYLDYLKDREVTSKDHKTRTEDYLERGRKIERVLEIFQTWFVIPWILYFIGSSLNMNQFLKFWKEGVTGTGQYDLSEITHVVYSAKKIFLLTFAYLCSRTMNAHHQKYTRQSRRKQLDKFKKTASRMALAAMNKIEKEEHFDFVPRVWGTSIKIHMDSPLYIILLLVGIFFTVIDACV